MHNVQSDTDLVHWSLVTCHKPSGQSRLIQPQFNINGGFCYVCFMFMLQTVTLVICPLFTKAFERQSNGNTSTIIPLKPLIFNFLMCFLRLLRYNTWGYIRGTYHQIIRSPRRDTREFDLSSKKERIASRFRAWKVEVTNVTNVASPLSL